MSGFETLVGATNIGSLIVSIFTLGQKTKDNKAEITSYLTAANQCLLDAMEELRAFSIVLTDDEFERNLARCTSLHDDVYEQMKRRTQKINGNICSRSKQMKERKKQAMEKETECRNTKYTVKELSTKAARRLETKVLGSFKLPDDGTLAARDSRLKAFQATLQSMQPTTALIHGDIKLPLKSVNLKLIL
ncbi:hypothetical protein H0H81_006311 [Sphagnurus paluster]|uniref:Uncharacterized protein n=1 Tax=Sphagnurus paluster TaxID=117069 RepID=A0A9P7GSB0_9AGAR|nr:hypothetical protein H0H81_006311 [Sphagnurus paluster]